MRRHPLALLAAPALGWLLAVTVALPAGAAPAGGQGPPRGHRVPPATRVLHAALVDLSRRTSFRTIRSAPSLGEVTVVEPRARVEAATLSFRGPRGRGTLRVVVAGGTEDLEGDAAGWRDFLIQSGAPPTTVALAEGLAGTWYSTPARIGFGPTLSGIGHVFCSGRGCTLSGARLLSSRGPLVLLAPGFGGRLALRAGHRPLPLVLEGTGDRAGTRLRFAYPARTPRVSPPAATVPLPGALGD